MKRENYLNLITEARNLSEKLSLLSIETTYLNAVTEGDKKLKVDKNNILLQNLQSALADATHHLHWL